jgi:hypothetical protein
MSWIRSIQKDWIGKKEEKNRFSVDLPWHVMCCAVFHCLQLGVIDWVTMSAFIWGLGLQNSFKIYI